MSEKSEVNFITMKTVLSVFLLLGSFITTIDCKNEDKEKDNTDNNPYEFHIGGVLSSNNSESYFKQTIEVGNLKLYNMIFI